MKKYLIIYNGSAGKSDNEAIAKKAQSLLESNGKSVTLSQTKSRDDAVKQAQKSPENYDCLITIGGDGSTNTACEGFLKAGQSIPLGIIPGGTINNFARALHIPLNTDQAINNLLDGSPAEVDLGAVGKTPMVSSLTLGRLADIARNVKDDEKKRFGKMIYLVKGFKELFTNRSYKLKITANDRSEVLRAQILLITTTNSVGGFIAFNPDASYDDDYLHVFLLKSFTPMKLLTYLSYFITGNLKNAQGVRYFKTTTVKIDNLSKRDIQARIDGDPAMSLPITVTTKSDFLQVIVPRASHEES
ncbi:diacylglycerol/lipid kinase family protein [Lentilactobacillus buchneri]|uniref:diacylglycerol/lipid kinase family protein n=1 Tax=Lentilactobacillus buchneri TaxID=1581 RepID=UPI001290A70B|nr:diacylglycerol kinase family protein [Lentilactobacillus buchneri]MQM76878.1 diacylglycerol kinase family lipid kinase [Lentilactobacillus buchneri]MQM86933.1 diacylglycerol kinase family lipid kinase [Lentilactobacillus buchneri]MQN21409.1 diacylglycerol kinase family lipid kinase [Lentilactobacillus buchneri]